MSSDTHVSTETAPPGPAGPRRGRAFLDGLRADAPASLVVFLVALPLSLGIAAARCAGDWLA